MTELSVVLISKNQDWNIARLVESVIKQTRSYSCEIILVDSASDDGTLQAACAYPITVLALSPDQRLTAAAGRTTGLRYSSGRYVLFLDGDMELCEGWLERALAVVEARPEIAVVNGPWINVHDYVSNGTPPAEIRCNCCGQVITAGRPFTRWNWSYPRAKAHEVPAVGGAALYRREVLEQVGAFNPYLFSEEEPDVCLRIRHAGYRIWRLEHPIAFHYAPPPLSIRTSAGRWRRNLYLGQGQNLRYYVGTPYFWPSVRERASLGLSGAGLFAILVGWLGLALIRRWRIFIGGGLVLGGLIGACAFSKHSLTKAINGLGIRLFMFEGIVRGFWMKPLPPSSYPFDVRVIQRGELHSRAGYPINIAER